MLLKQRLCVRWLMKVSLKLVGFCLVFGIGLQLLLQMLLVVLQWFIRYSMQLLMFLIMGVFIVWVLVLCFIVLLLLLSMVVSILLLDFLKWIVKLQVLGLCWVVKLVVKELGFLLSRKFILFWWQMVIVWCLWCSIVVKFICLNRLCIVVV